MPALKPEVNVPVEIALKYQNGKEVTSQIDGKSQIMYTLTSGDQLYVSPAVADQIDALGVVPGEFFRLVKREIRDGVRRSTRYEVSLLDPAAQREHYTAAQQPSSPAHQQPIPGQPAPRPARAPQPSAPPPSPARSPQAAAQLMDQGPPAAWDDIPDHALDQQLAASIVQAHERKANVTPMPARQETTARSAPPAVATNAFSLVAQVLGNALVSAFDAAQQLEAYAASRGVAMRMEPEHVKCMAISIFIELQRSGATRQQPAAPAAAHNGFQNGTNGRGNAIRQ